VAYFRGRPTCLGNFDDIFDDS